jgi:predicted alpha-1,6-mannanase (GH76 family)
MQKQVGERPRAVGYGKCFGLASKGHKIDFIYRWDKNHDADNAIENSLYLTTAAKLANRKPSTPSDGYYLNEAIKAYTFITQSGLINSQYLLNDGLFPNSSAPNSCKNNNGTIWSYNQGAPLAGLAEMTISTGDSKYNDLAIKIATAAIDSLTDSNTILHDACETNLCPGDGGQFKGVFARNVQFLVNRVSNLPAGSAELFRSFLRKNAQSIWDRARSGARLGPVWSGPYYEASVQHQSSALDAIVGAACVS